MDARQERGARRGVNNLLYDLSRTYHANIPLTAIDNILGAHGFEVTEAGIYCGREGRNTERVGPNTWLSLTWYRMEETGRYEIICYVS